MNPIMTNMLKGLVPLIKNHIGDVDRHIHAYLAAIELEPGEARAAILCATRTGDGGQPVAWIITCTLDEADTPRRVIRSTPAADFIEKLISQL